MRASRTALLFASTVAVACAGNPDRQTLSRLHSVEPDMREVKIEDGLEQAMIGYRTFLAEVPVTRLEDDDVITNDLDRTSVPALGREGTENDGWE